MRGNNNTKDKSIVRKIFSIISWVLTGLLTVLVILLLVFGISSMRQGKLMKIFGYSYSVIASGSMEPTINVNDMILIDTKYDYDKIETDDIIVFYNPVENKNIAHRVIGRYEDGSLKTCGDNNQGRVDTFHVTEEYFLGKVVKYGRCLGIGALIINGRMVFFIALAAVFLYVIIAEFINIYKMIMMRKHEMRMKEIKENKEKQEQDMRAKMKEELRKELEAQNKK